MTFLTISKYFENFRNFNFSKNYRKIKNVWKSPKSAEKYIILKNSDLNFFYEFFENMKHANDQNSIFLSSLDARTAYEEGQSLLSGKWKARSLSVSLVCTHLRVFSGAETQTRHPNVDQKMATSLVYLEAWNKKPRRHQPFTVRLCDVISTLRASEKKFSSQIWTCFRPLFPVG